MSRESYTMEAATHRPGTAPGMVATPVINPGVVAQVEIERKV